MVFSEILPEALIWKPFSVSGYDYNFSGSLLYDEPVISDDIDDFGKASKNAAPWLHINSCIIINFCNSFLLRLIPDIATKTITNSLWVANISREYSLMICEIIITKIVRKRFIYTNRKITFPKCELLWSEENRTTGHWPNQRVGCH